ncbi:hypothetical protein KKF63_06040, partial [bacterium]|nr:hypothetical protein [bacterium]
IPGEARVVSVADVELVGSYYTRMQTQNPGDDAIRIVGENYRSLIVADTSVAGHSADYAGRGVDQGFFGNDVPGVRTLDHHGDFALGAEGQTDARNSTMKMLDVMEEALARHDGNIERAVQELNIGAATTDNLGDGGWCVWMARNQRQVLADGNLRNMIREATFFEDVSAFGTTYLGQEGSPALQLQAAIFFEYNRILDEHGIVGTDRFSDAQAASILEQACAAIDHMVADETARAQAADAFFRDVEGTAHLASEEAVISNASVDGQVVFFDTSKLGGASTFTRFLAIPRAHALSMHVNCVPLPGNKYLYFVGIPHDRSLPSGKSLVDVVDRVRAAEAAKAVALGIEAQDIWVAKAEVMFVAKGKTSLLTPDELSAILTDPDLGLFGSKAVTELPTPDKVTGPLATVTGRDGVYRLLDAQDPDNVTVIGPIDQNANQMFRVRLSDVTPLQRKTIDETQAQDMPVAFSHHLLTMRERSRRYTLEMGSQGKDFGLDLSHESVAGVHAMLRFDKAKDSYAIAPRRGQAVWIKRGNDTFCLPGDSKSIKEFYLQDGDLIQFGDAIPIRFEKPTHTMHAYPQVSQSTVNELAALPPVVIAEPVNIDGALITRDHRGFYYVTEPGAEGVTLLDHGTLIKTDNGYVTFKRPEFAAGDGAMFKGGDLREQWVVVKSEGDQITIWREGSDERIVSASELSKMTDDDQHSFAGSDYSRYQKARPAQAQPAVPAAPSIAKNDIVSIEGQEGTYQVVDFKGDDAFVIGPQESAEPNLLKFPKSQMLLADVQQANIDVASMPEAFSRKMVSLQKNALRPGVLPIVLMRKGSAEQYGLDFTHPSNENLNVIFSYKQEGDFYELTAMGEGQVIITRDGDSVPVPISNGEHQVILKDGDIIQFGETAPFRWQEPERIDLDAPSHENPIAMDLDARQSRVPVVDVAQPIVPVTRARAEADVLHLKRLFRSKTTLHFGPSKSLERKVLTIMPDAEIFVAASKLKHHGRIEVMQDPKGTRVIKFIDAITGAEEFFLPEEIIAVRERGDEGYAQSMDLCRVDNPHLADKSINASGRLGNRMQVLVDYTDPRLQRFFKKSGLEKLRTVLDEGNLNKQDAAQAAWQIIKTKVKYDYSRLEEDGSPDNRMYNLSEFLDEGVCNERGMLLQVALQYLGIESQLEKGTVVRKYDADPLQGQRVFGRHAWVRVTDPDILKPREILILDPQVDDPLYSYYLPNGRIYVLDTQTLFVRDRAETFVIGASAREAFVNGAAMLEGADGVGARSATDTGIISADEMARSTLDPDARMDTGEIVVDVSTVPQRGHPARHQEPIGRVELKGSEFDSSNFAQQLARFTDDVESRETIPLEIHVDDITLINRTEFDNTIKTTFQETGATWSVVAIHDQKTNQVVYHYVNIDPSVGSPKVLEIPVRSSVERGHQIAKQYMTIDDYSKIEETISHWPIENQNLFWQEIESLVCQVVEPRIILPFGGKNKPFKISTDHPNVSAQINGLLATIDPYFQPLESMKPFRRVVGTHEQAVDYHVTNPKPSDYLTQEGLSNTFIDNTGQPQEYFVPHYVQEKIDGWMNLVTHDLNTETKGKLVVETRDDGSLMIVDFIPHATISESIVLSAIQDYGEGQMHSLALPAGRVSRILGYDSEVANPVSVEGLTTIDMHTHFYGDQMQSAYQDSPSPPDFRSKGVKKIEAVCTPKSGLIFYVRATEDDPDFGKHTTIYSRDMTSEQQGGNT